MPRWCLTSSGFLIRLSRYSNEKASPIPRIAPPKKPNRRLLALFGLAGCRGVSAGSTIRMLLCLVSRRCEESAISFPRYSRGEKCAAGDGRDEQKRHRHGERGQGRFATRPTRETNEARDRPGEDGASVEETFEIIRQRRGEAVTG